MPLATHEQHLPLPAYLSGAVDLDRATLTIEVRRYTSIATTPTYNAHNPWHLNMKQLLLNATCRAKIQGMSTAMTIIVVLGCRAGRTSEPEVSSLLYPRTSVNLRKAYN